MQAEELALQIRRRQRISGNITTERLYDLADSVGLEIVEYPFQLFDEVYFEEVVGINPRLTAPWRRWLIAHALNHHLSHDGNQLFYDSTDQKWWTNRQERAANLFAGFLLWGPYPIYPLTIYEFAEVADAPPLCVENWRRLCEVS